MFANGFDAGGPALGFADHGDEAGLLQHHLRELVHARRGGGTGGTHDFAAHRIDRTDVVDDAIAEIHAGRQRLALGEQIGDALVSGIAPGEHAAVEQQLFARLPARHFRGRQRVEIDSTRVGRGRPVDLRPVGEFRRHELRGAAAVEREMHVPRGGAVRDHGHGLGRRVRGVFEDLHIEHGGQAAQPLRADAERIHLFVELDAQLFGLVRRTTQP